jgi:hypothetical protein
METCAYTLKFIAERVPRSGFLPFNELPFFGEAKVLKGSR